MVEGSKSFVKLDLAITRAMHLVNIERGVYPVLDPDLDPVLTIRQEDIPTFNDLKILLEKVGRPYGWHLRREYHQPKSVAEISEVLKDPRSRRYSFWSGNKEVGGTIIANVEKDVGRIFEKAHDNDGVPIIEPALAAKTIEIYKIGLFPEYTKRGWGKHFLPQVLTALFNHESKPEVVYLNTRNTNHNGVIGFYTGFNMNVIHGRSLPNDLISEEEYNRRNKPANQQPPQQQRLTLLQALLQTLLQALLQALLQTFLPAIAQHAHNHLPLVTIRQILPAVLRPVGFA